MSALHPTEGKTTMDNEDRAEVAQLTRMWRRWYASTDGDVSVLEPALAEMLLHGEGYGREALSDAIFATKDDALAAGLALGRRLSPIYQC